MICYMSECGWKELHQKWGLIDIMLEYKLFEAYYLFKFYMYCKLDAKSNKIIYNFIRFYIYAVHNSIRL